MALLFTFKLSAGYAIATLKAFSNPPGVFPNAAVYSLLVAQPAIVALCYHWLPCLVHTGPLLYSHSRFAIGETSLIAIATIIQPNQQ